VTTIYSLNDPARRSEGFAEAKEALSSGALVVMPTDTVYGIAAAAGREDACGRLYELKERSPSQPTAIMLGSVPGLLAALPEMDERTAATCRRLLPGAVTLVVANPAGRFPHACGEWPHRIGVRVPDLEPEVAELADAAGGLVITSANLRGGPDPATLAQVPRKLHQAAAFAVDAGPLPGRPSSVIDVSGERPVVLREGPDLAALLEAVEATA
jgi:L-threonylcarbamoyladenylate synthase